MPECQWENTALARWTFLRYGVLGMIMLCRVRTLRTKLIHEEGRGCEHPKLTKKILTAGRVKSFILAGCLFVLTEGIGLVIYFAVSAMMDNVTIFFFKEGELCKTVSAVSLYTMSIVSFLPNVFLGIWLQGRCYNRRRMILKVLFVVAMTGITAASFGVRLWIVYSKGYAAFVDSSLERTHAYVRVVIAVLVPPLVDGIQSITLVVTGAKAEPKVDLAVGPDVGPFGGKVPLGNKKMLHDDKYYVGEIVSAFRPKKSDWVQAKVEFLCPDGSVDVVFPPWIGGSKSSIKETEVAPWPTGRTIYHKNQEVTVLGKGGTTWVQGKVENVSEDDSCKVGWTEYLRGRSVGGGLGGMYIPMNAIRMGDDIPVHAQPWMMKPKW
jgi:hypothetical protein